MSGLLMINNNKIVSVILTCNIYISIGTFYLDLNVRIWIKINCNVFIATIVLHFYTA